MRLARDRRINVVWHPLRTRPRDLDAYGARHRANQADAIAASPKLLPIAGADGELIDRLIVLLSDPPIPGAVAWTSDVLTGLIGALDLWDHVAWFDPIQEPALALGQFRDWLYDATYDPDDLLDEVDVVDCMLAEVTALVDDWASARFEERVERNRAEAKRALGDPNALRAMLARLNRRDRSPYGHMAEDEFAAELRRNLQSLYMQPRQPQQVAEAIRLAEGWGAARGSTLGDAVIDEWRSAREE